MKQGALIFDERSDRYDIRFDLADYYGGLHCGETFDVMVGGRWTIISFSFVLRVEGLEHTICYCVITQPV